MRKVVSVVVALIFGTSFTAYAKSSAKEVQQSKTAISLVSEEIFLKQQYSRDKVPDNYFYQAQKKITDEIVKLEYESLSSAPQISNLLRKCQESSDLSTLTEVQKQLLELEKQYGQSA